MQIHPSITEMSGDIRLRSGAGLAAGVLSGLPSLGGGAKIVSGRNSTTDGAASVAPEARH
jgi:hypothetical protein